MANNNNGGPGGPLSEEAARELESIYTSLEEGGITDLPEIGEFTVQVATTPDGRRKLQKAAQIVSPELEQRVQRLEQALPPVQSAMPNLAQDAGIPQPGQPQLRQLYDSFQQAGVQDLPAYEGFEREVLGSEGGIDKLGRAVEKVAPGMRPVLEDFKAELRRVQQPVEQQPQRPQPPEQQEYQLPDYDPTQVQQPTYTTQQATTGQQGVAQVQQQAAEVEAAKAGGAIQQQPPQPGFETAEQAQQAPSLPGLSMAAQGGLYRVPHAKSPEELAKAHYKDRWYGQTVAPASEMDTDVSVERVTGEQFNRESVDVVRRIMQVKRAMDRAGVDNPAKLDPEKHDLPEDFQTNERFYIGALRSTVPDTGGLKSAQGPVDGAYRDPETGTWRPQRPDVTMENIAQAAQLIESEGIQTLEQLEAQNPKLAEVAHDVYLNDYLQGRHNVATSQEQADVLREQTRIQQELAAKEAQRVDPVADWWDYAVDPMNRALDQFVGTIMAPANAAVQVKDPKTGELKPMNQVQFEGQSKPTTGPAYTSDFRGSVYDEFAGAVGSFAGYATMAYAGGPWAAAGTGAAQGLLSGQRDVQQTRQRQAINQWAEIMNHSGLAAVNEETRDKIADALIQGNLDQYQELVQESFPDISGQTRAQIASDAEANTHIALSTGIGALEGIPFALAWRPISKLTPRLSGKIGESLLKSRTFLRNTEAYRGGRFLIGGPGEMFEEWGAQVLQNVSAQQTIDETREVFTNEAVRGGVYGLFLGGLMSALSKRGVSRAEAADQQRLMGELVNMANQEGLLLTQDKLAALEEQRAQQGAEVRNPQGLSHAMMGGSKDLAQQEPDQALASGSEAGLVYHEELQQDAEGQPDETFLSDSEVQQREEYLGKVMGGRKEGEGETEGEGPQLDPLSREEVRQRIEETARQNGYDPAQMSEGMYQRMLDHAARYMRGYTGAVTTQVALDKVEMGLADRAGLTLNEFRNAVRESFAQQGVEMNGSRYARALRIIAKRMDQKGVSEAEVQQTIDQTAQMVQAATPEAVPYTGQGYTEEEVAQGEAAVAADMGTDRADVRGQMELQVADYLRQASQARAEQEGQQEGQQQAEPDPQVVRDITDRILANRARSGETSIQVTEQDVASVMQGMSVQRKLDTKAPKLEPDALKRAERDLKQSMGTTLSALRKQFRDRVKRALPEEATKEQIDDLYNRAVSAAWRAQSQGARIQTKIGNDLFYDLESLYSRIDQAAEAGTLDPERYRGVIASLERRIHQIPSISHTHYGMKSALLEKVALLKQRAGLDPAAETEAGMAEEATVQEAPTEAEGVARIAEGVEARASRARMRAREAQRDQVSAEEEAELQRGAALDQETQEAIQSVEAYMAEVPQEVEDFFLSDDPAMPSSKVYDWVDGLRKRLSDLKMRQQMLGDDSASLRNYERLQTYIGDIEASLIRPATHTIDLVEWNKEIEAAEARRDLPADQMIDIMDRIREIDAEIAELTLADAQSRQQQEKGEAGVRATGTPEGAFLLTYARGQQRARVQELIQERERLQREWKNNVTRSLQSSREREAIAARSPARFPQTPTPIEPATAQGATGQTQAQTAQAAPAPTQQAAQPAQPQAQAQQAPVQAQQPAQPAQAATTPAALEAQAQPQQPQQPPTQQAAQPGQMQPQAQAQPEPAQAATPGPDAQSQAEVRPGMTPEVFQQKKDRSDQAFHSITQVFTTMREARQVHEELRTFVQEAADSLGIPVVSDTIVEAMEGARLAAIDRIEEVIGRGIQAAEAEGIMAYMQAFEAALFDKAYRIYQGEIAPDEGQRRSSYAPERLLPERLQERFRDMQSQLQNAGFSVGFDVVLDEAGRYTYQGFSIKQGAGEALPDNQAPAVLNAADAFISASKQRRQGLNTLRSRMLKGVAAEAREKIVDPYRTHEQDRMTWHIAEMNQALDNYGPQQALKEITEAEAADILLDIQATATETAQPDDAAVQLYARTLDRVLFPKMREEADVDLTMPHTTIDFAVRALEDPGVAGGESSQLYQDVKNLANKLGLTDPALYAPGMPIVKRGYKKRGRKVQGTSIEVLSDSKATPLRKAIKGEGAATTTKDNLTLGGFLRQAMNYNRPVPKDKLMLELSQYATEKTPNPLEVLYQYMDEAFREAPDAAESNVMLEAMRKAEAQEQPVPLLDNMRVPLGNKKPNLARRTAYTEANEHYEAQQPASENIADQGWSEVRDAEIPAEAEREMRAYTQAEREHMELRQQSATLLAQMEDLSNRLKSGPGDAGALNAQYQQAQSQLERVNRELNQVERRLYRSKTNNVLYDGSSFYFSRPEGTTGYATGGPELPLKQDDIDKNRKGEPIITVINDFINNVNDAIKASRTPGVRERLGLKPIKDAARTPYVRILRNRHYGEPEAVPASYSEKTGTIYMKRNTGYPAVEVLAHEFGHFVYDQFGLMDAIGDPATYQEQYPGVDLEAARAKLYEMGRPFAVEDANMRTVLHEGFAKFMVNYIRNPDMAETEYGDVSKAFNVVMSASDLGGEVQRQLLEFSRRYRSTKSVTDVWEGVTNNVNTVTEMDEKPPIGQFGSLRWWNGTMRGVRDYITAGFDYNRGVFTAFTDRLFFHPLSIAIRDWKSMAHNMGFDVDQYGEIQGEHAAEIRKVWGKDYSVLEDIRKHYQLLMAHNSKILRQIEGNGLQKADGSLAIDPATNSSLTLEWLMQPINNTTRRQTEEDYRRVTALLITERTKDLINRPISVTLKDHKGESRRAQVRFGLDENRIQMDGEPASGTVRHPGVFLSEIEMERTRAERKAIAEAEVDEVLAEVNTNLSEADQRAETEAILLREYGGALEAAGKSLAGQSKKQMRRTAIDTVTRSVERTFTVHNLDLNASGQSVQYSEDPETAAEEQMRGRIDRAVGLARGQVADEKLTGVSNQNEGFVPFRMGEDVADQELKSGPETDITIWARAMAELKQFEQTPRQLTITHQATQYTAEVDPYGIPASFTRETDGAVIKPEDAPDQFAEMRRELFNVNGMGNEFFRIKEAVRRYRVFAKEILRYAVDKGYMSEEAFEHIIANNDHYVAMNRDFEEIGDKERNLIGAQSMGSAGQIVHPAKGSARTVKDVYTNLINQAKWRLYEVERNELVSNFIKMVEAAQEVGFEGGDYAVRVSARAEKPSNTIVVRRNGVREYWQITDQDLLKDLVTMGSVSSSHGIHKVLKPFQWTAQAFRNLITTFPDFPIRAAIRDVERRWFISRNLRTSSANSLTKQFPALSKDFYDFLSARDYGTYRQDKKGIAPTVPTMLQRQLEENPNMKVVVDGETITLAEARNRYTTWAQLWQKLALPKALQGRVSLPDYFNQDINETNKQPYFETLQEMKEAGADQFGWYATNPKQAAIMMRDELDRIESRGRRQAAREEAEQGIGEGRPSIAMPMSYMAKGGLRWLNRGLRRAMEARFLPDWYERTVEHGEFVNRVAEYRAAKRKGMEELGMTEQEARFYAAFEARDLMDFGLRGYAMQEAGRYFPFMNAGFQAFRRTLKAFTEGKATAAVSMMRLMIPSTLMQVMRMGLYDEDDWADYWQMPNYRRDFFWSLPMGDSWIHIPKDYDIAVFDAIVERTIDQVNGDPYAFYHNFDGKINGFIPSLLARGVPVSTDIAYGGTNPALASLTQLARNYDPFRERPILREDQQGDVGQSMLLEQQKWISGVEEGQLGRPFSGMEIERSMAEALHDSWFSVPLVLAFGEESYHPKNIRMLLENFGGTWGRVALDMGNTMLQESPNPRTEQAWDSITRNFVPLMGQHNPYARDLIWTMNYMAHNEASFEALSRQGALQDERNAIYEAMGMLSQMAQLSKMGHVPDDGHNHVIGKLRDGTLTPGDIVRGVQQKNPQYTKRDLRQAIGFISSKLRPIIEERLEPARQKGAEALGRAFDKAEPRILELLYGQPPSGQ